MGFAREVEGVDGFSNSFGLTRFQMIPAGPVLIATAIKPADSSGGLLEIIESQSAFEVGAWQESIDYPQYGAFINSLTDKSIQIPANQAFSQVFNVKGPYAVITYSGNGMLKVLPLGIVPWAPSSLRLGAVDVVPGL
jgi:hypothetical protein